MIEFRFPAGFSGERQPRKFRVGHISHREMVMIRPNFSTRHTLHLGFIAFFSGSVASRLLTSVFRKRKRSRPAGHPPRRARLSPSSVHRNANPDHAETRVPRQSEWNFGSLKNGSKKSAPANRLENRKESQTINNTDAGTQTRITKQHPATVRFVGCLEDARKQFWAARRVSSEIGVVRDSVGALDRLRGDAGAIGMKSPTRSNNPATQPAGRLNFVTRT